MTKNNEQIEKIYICNYGQTEFPVCVDLGHEFCKLDFQKSKECNLRAVVSYDDYLRKEQECKELKKANDEKNELLLKLGCPTTATAKRQVFTLEQQISLLKAENKELKAENDTYKSSIIANLDKSISKRYRELLEENDQLKKEIKTLKKLLKEENCNFDKIKDLTNDR